MSCTFSSHRYKIVVHDHRIAHLCSVSRKNILGQESRRLKSAGRDFTSPYSQPDVGTVNFPLSTFFLLIYSENDSRTNWSPGRILPVPLLLHRHIGNRRHLAVPGVPSLIVNSTDWDCPGLCCLFTENSQNPLTGHGNIVIVWDDNTVPLIATESYILPCTWPNHTKPSTLRSRLPWCNVGVQEFDIPVGSSCACMVSRSIFVLQLVYRIDAG